MFVVGIIVGMILGIAAYFAFGVYVVKRIWNLKSRDEIAEASHFLELAGNNRECVAHLWKDDDLLETLVFDDV